MGPDFWERYVNPDSRYRYDEKTHRLNHHRNEFWQSEGGTLKQNYNNIRDSEIQTRNREIFSERYPFLFFQKWYHRAVHFTCFLSAHLNIVD